MRRCYLSLLCSTILGTSKLKKFEAVVDRVIDYIKEGKSIEYIRTHLQGEGMNESIVHWSIKAARMELEQVIELPEFNYDKK